jgi:signal transduction histidine kinase/ActR/RegA family two-component response regulator
LLDKTEEDLLASDLRTFFPSADLPASDGRKTGNRDSPLLDFEQEFERTAGGKVWLSATLAAVGASTREHRYYVLLVRDVSERRQAEQERKKMEARLSQAERLESIGSLAGGVAHDFNNLLTVIVGYADMALATAPDHPVREELEEILKASRRAASLTRQLLAFGRAQVLHPERVRLNQRLGNMRELLSHTLGENIELQLDMDPKIGEVLVDAGQMDQVFLNLALNARDAMPEGGTLSVRTAAESDSTVRLTFRDTGVGMDAETRRRAFEPFFTSKGVGEGAGLGLASVYGIINQSGGEISLDSKLGEGTTVLISLPAVTSLPLMSSDREQRMRHTTSIVEPDVSGTVLVVEDEDSLRDLVRDILGSAGYSVLTASNGHQALDLAESHQDAIHLLLTDVIMPGMNGKEVASRLSQDMPDLRVLFMTGYSDRRTQLDKALTAGARLIHKPFTPDQLLQAVRWSLQQTEERGAAG